MLPNLREALPRDPVETARRFYVDDLVYDAPTLRRGTDYPFAIMDR